jgi:hypothetical protein
MDMHAGLSNGYAGEETFATPGTEYVQLAEHRRHVFALITEFQRAVARPGGLNDAIRILHALLSHSGAYFAIVESLLDKLTAAGAGPYRDEHQQILVEIRQVLDRCSASDGKAIAAEVAHVLDALVIHEAAIRFRGSGDRS